MDVRNSTLVAAAALFLAVILAVITLSGLWYYGTPTRPVDTAVRRLPVRTARMPDRSNVAAELALSRTRAAELETRLSDAQRQLRASSRALEREEAKNADLQDEVNRSLNLALQLVDVPPTRTSKTTGAAEAPDTEGVGSPDMAEELSQLREQLAESEQEIAFLELSSDQDAAQLLANSSAFRQAIGKVVAAIGEPAVDTILPALEHEQAAVREWAAVVLGRIGPKAVNASEALREASERDRDERVRIAARRALMLVAD